MSNTEHHRAVGAPFGVGPHPAGRGLRQTTKKQEESVSSTIAALQAIVGLHSEGGSQ